MIHSDRLWLGPLGRRRRPEFDDDWISMAREERLGRRLRPQLMTRMTGFLWMTGCMKDWPTVGCASGTLVPMIQQVLVLFHYILHKHEFIYEFKGHEHSSLKSWSWNLIWIFLIVKNILKSYIKNVKFRKLQVERQIQTIKGINLTDTIQPEQQLDLRKAFKQEKADNKIAMHSSKCRPNNDMGIHWGLGRFSWRMLPTLLLTAT